MPYRKIPLISGEIYHVFNRSIGRQPIFLSKRDYRRTLEIIKFYIYKPRLSFSHYNRLTQNEQIKFLDNLQDSGTVQVELLVYCLMPNHFHFLIKGLTDKGITDFMRNFQNSYTKYFNIKNDRNGALFQSMFKAVRIESDEQLIHVGRYIHLNPLTSYIIKTANELQNYQWCSFAEYLDNNNSGFINM